MPAPDHRTKEEDPEFENPLREKLWRIVFLADTPGSRRFDIVLLWLIGLSVLTVMLESVPSYREQHAALFRVLEWIFTIIFTIEYALRIWIVRRKKHYIFSFFGIVDFLAILPTYVALFLAGSQYLMVVRILRLLRMFRVLKMVRHMEDALLLTRALKQSRSKIAVFLFGVFSLVCIQGTFMYLIENRVPDSGFTSIPQSIYWGIVTITTVGYGDISPVTVLGKILASFMMLTGFAILAVPTGIVTAELHREIKRTVNMDDRSCGKCGQRGHDPIANFCKHCGERIV